MSLLDDIPEHPGTVGSMMTEPTDGPAAQVDVQEQETSTKRGSRVRFGKDRCIKLSDAEIERNNRLSLLMQIHKERAAANQNEQKQEVEHMARKQTMCDGCGKIKALSNCSGELLCSSCAATAGSISNRPDAVAKMIIKRGMSEKILEALGVNQVAAVAVESELLEKLKALVAYEGESGGELVGVVERRINEHGSLEEACRAYDIIFDELFKVMGVEHGKVVELMASIRSIKSAPEPAAAPPGSIGARIFAELCRVLGLDKDDELLASQDLVVGVAQVAAQLEQTERILDEVAVITDASSFDHADVLKAVRHSEALLEEIDRQLSTATEPEIVRQAQQMAQQINVQAEQLSEAEQKLLADEQVFARIREVIGADGAAPGDIPGAIETLITLSPAPRLNGNRNVDSHLLDLLTEFPQIGVERIAVLREAV